ncbi:unnamed protein product [Candida parapsilosis]
MDTLRILSYSHVWYSSTDIKSGSDVYSFMYPFWVKTFTVKDTVEYLIDESWKVFFVNARREFIKKLNNVTLHMSPSSLESFAKMDAKLEPQGLEIKIKPNENNSFVKQISGHGFKNLISFTFDYPW